MNNFEVIACDTDSLFFKKPDGAPFSKEEIGALQTSLNSLYPKTISWELNGYFPVIVSAAAKNYLIKSEDGSIKFKGSAIKATGKETALREFIQTFITLLAEDKSHEVPELYNFVVQEICDIKDISRWCSKKTVTDKVLNPERTNEQKILDALKGEELQEGDKVYMFFKNDRTLCLQKNFTGDYDQKGFLDKLFKSALIFDQIYPVRQNLLNYALKRNQTLLKSITERPEEKFIAQLPPALQTLVKAPTTLPKPSQVFRAMTYFKPEETKVIIIGQDCYYTPGDACGLAFSVEHNKFPPSLMNIFKELKNDLNIEIPKTGNLESWAKQGVLLLNSILTVEQGKSLSHANLGWEKLTTQIIQKVVDYNNPIVLIAWGKVAQQKLEELKLHSKCLILKSGHPSPLGNPSKNFFGNKHFSQANKFLLQNNIKPIDWDL